MTLDSEHHLTRGMIEKHDSNTLITSSVYPVDYSNLNVFTWHCSQCDNNNNRALFQESNTNPFQQVTEGLVTSIANNYGSFDGISCSNNNGLNVPHWTSSRLDRRDKRVEVVSCPLSKRVNNSNPNLQGIHSGGNIFCCSISSLNKNSTELNSSSPINKRFTPHVHSSIQRKTLDTRVCISNESQSSEDIISSLKTENETQGISLQEFSNFCDTPKNIPIFQQQRSDKTEYQSDLWAHSIHNKDDVVVPNSSCCMPFMCCNDLDAITKLTSPLIIAIMSKNGQHPKIIISDEKNNQNYVLSPVFVQHFGVEKETYTVLPGKKWLSFICTEIMSETGKSFSYIARLLVSTAN